MTISSINSYYDPNTNEKVLVSEATPLPIQTPFVTEAEPLPVHASGAFMDGALVNPSFSVTTSGVEVKVGASPLAGRHTVTLINDSSAMLSFSVGTNATFANSIKLFSGAAVQLSLNPNENVPVYVRAPYFNTTIGIIENAG